MSKVKIFITEDEFLIAKNLENKVGELGYKVIGTAASGEETLEKLKIELPDLILMDIMLAGKMDGVETAQIIKDRYDIPLIFLTSYSSKEIYLRAESTKPYGFILKPFESRDIDINISMTLYKSKAEKELKEKQKSLELLNEELDSKVKERTKELIEKYSELETEIKTREQAQEKESRLVEVIKQAEDHIMIINVKGNIEYVNPQMMGMTGYSEEDLYGNSHQIFNAGTHPKSFYKNLWRRVLAGETFKGEFVNKKKNGEVYISDQTIVPLLNSDNEVTHFASIGRDITEERDFEKNMIYFLEKEKERISKELHDGIGQSITATKYSLMALLNSATIPDEVDASVKGIINQIDDLTKELRSVSFELMPSILKDYGLKSAVSKIVKVLTVNGNVTINFVYDCPVDRYSETIDLGIYRIIQEALNNCIKHSSGDLITVKISQSDNEPILLAIIDNGEGFNVDNYKKGQGISNMQQRVNLLQGFFNIVSDKKAGTKILVEVPILQ